jgi:hypothetical protein
MSGHKGETHSSKGSMPLGEAHSECKLASEVGKLGHPTEVTGSPFIESATLLCLVSLGRKNGTLKGLKKGTDIPGFQYKAGSVLTFHEFSLGPVVPLQFMFAWIGETLPVGIE